MYASIGKLSSAVKAEMLDLKIGFSPSISDSSIFISKCPPESLSWVRLTLDLVDTEEKSNITTQE